MTRPQDYEKEQGRPRDNSDRAADLSVDDAAAQPAQPGNDPEGVEEDLRVVEQDEVGAGDGLDEAELARVDPLNHQRWDGDPSEPLKPAPPADEGYPASNQDPEQNIEDQEGQ